MQPDQGQVAVPPRRRADDADLGSPFLATKLAGAGERRLALGVVLVSLAIFAACAPFARTPLSPVPAFLPVYQSALIINDVITAVLLFGQYGILRSRALLVLACAYLFSGLMAAAHLASFPGLFAQGGLLGAGPQTTAWLYFLWHGAFPLMVIAYSLHSGPAENPEPSGRLRGPIVAGVAATLAAWIGFTLLATAGHEWLPVIMSGQSDAPGKVVVATASWLLCFAALAALWRRRPLSVLDLWLMVVMCAWILDVALAAVLNAGRFDVGWYAGRVYGLAAASFVLVVMLVENGSLYAHLARARERERRWSQGALARQSERLRILHEIDKAIISRSTVEDIAGEAIEPLRRLLGVPRAIVNLFDLEAGMVEWLAAAGRRRLHVGPGVRYPIRLMGDVEALRRGEPQVVDTTALPDSAERTALLASGVKTYLVVPMIAGDELIGALSFGGETAVLPDDQVQIAREAATQMAIAISQVRLHERVRLQAEELELRVQERTAQLEAANRELEGFSYSVSHDLRTPLRAVDGYSRMLEEDYAGKLDEEGRRLIGVVRGEARRMGQLIDDLLAFARAARQPVAAVPLDMSALARDAAGELAPQYPHARVEIGPMPAAHGDRAMIRQVWSNLIGNALKYSAKHAAPRVDVDGANGGSELVYRVADNGAGFDMRYADKLFGVFQRLHADDEYPGTGVGLAIVQRVLARHGGRAWAEAAPGQGATFRFSLPVGSGPA